MFYWPRLSCVLPECFFNTFIFFNLLWFAFRYQKAPGKGGINQSTYTSPAEFQKVFPMYQTVVPQRTCLCVQKVILLHEKRAILVLYPLPHILATVGFDIARSYQVTHQYRFCTCTQSDDSLSFSQSL